MPPPGPCRTRSALTPSLPTRPLRRPEPPAAPRGRYRRAPSAAVTSTRDNPPPGAPGLESLLTCSLVRPVGSAFFVLVHTRLVRERQLHVGGCAALQLHPLRRDGSSG